MRQKIWLGLLVNFLLLSGCGHKGPKVTVWVSDPANAKEFVTSVKGKVVTLPYSESGGYSVFPPQSAQAVLNYCAARNQAGTAAPEFTSCLSIPAQSGFICHAESCVINATQNGMICSALAPKTAVSYADSDQYVSLSPADAVTLLAYCNIKLLGGLR